MMVKFFSQIVNKVGVLRISQFAIDRMMPDAIQMPSPHDAEQKSSLLHRTISSRFKT
jgi:hypothetical protein